MRIVTTFAAAGALLLAAGPASAVVLQMDASPAVGDSYFAFEAEDADSLDTGTPGWNITSYTGAFGGEVIQASTPSTTGASNQAKFQLQVTDPATADDTSFKMYIRWATPTSGDSIWTQGGNLDGFPGTLLAVPGGGSQTDLFWTSTFQTYSIPATAAVGDQFEFQFALREDGVVVDSIVLSQDKNLTDAELNAIIPEPASFALLGLGSIVAFARRRQA